MILIKLSTDFLVTFMFKKKLAIKIKHSNNFWNIF